jgi:4'-phosphopantetheinyl transferase
LNLESRISNLEFFMISHLYWLIQTLADVPEGEDWLSDGERDIASGFRFDKRRNDWRLGRWTMKRAVGAVLDCDLSAISALEIRAAADGAPEVFRMGKPVDVSISISHSNARSLCAVGPSKIAMGCDLERVEARDSRLVQDYFSPPEIAFCNADPSENALRVNLIWSAKESVLKALREGLRRDTRSILVCPDCRSFEGTWNPFSGRCLESNRTFKGWWRSQDGFVYTLASDISLEPSSL